MYVCIYTYTCIHICVSLSLSLCAYIYIYIYIYTHIHKVHLGSVDVTITQEQIRETFANLFGTVTDVHTPKDPRTGRS